VPSPVRLAVVVKMLKQKDFFLDHIKGSHHVFKDDRGRTFTVPVHHNQVKAVYVKEIQKL
jgi:predicted RNA binding protein YcfA (HicA-like mRNA interferase family)